MQINGPQSTGYIHGPHGLSGPHSAKGAQGGQAASTQATDQLDISPAAAKAAEAADGDIRTDLVAKLRSQIADGTYESADKLDTAVSRLLDEIG